MAMADELMPEEYRFLRTELETNKKFVFERPLLIIGTGMAVLGTFYNAQAIVLGPIALLAVLYFNLWFTQNRLRSSARIVAYLQLVHETGCRASPGWESALRLYRKQDDKTVVDDAKVDKDRDNLMFYSPIFNFHVWMGVFVAAAMVFGVVSSHWGRLNGLLTGLSVVNALAIPVYILAAYRFPLSELRSRIERDRQIWCRALPRAAKGGDDECSDQTS